MRCTLRAQSFPAWVTLLSDTPTSKKRHVLLQSTVRRFGFDTAASSGWLEHPQHFGHTSHMICSKGKRAPCDGADLKRLFRHGHQSSPLRFSSIGLRGWTWEPAEVKFWSTRSQQLEYTYIYKIFNAVRKISRVGHLSGRYPELENTSKQHGAVRVALGLGLFGVQHDLDTSQNLNISHVWYVQMGNGLHMIVVTWGHPFYHGHLSSHLSFRGLFSHGSVACWNIGDCTPKVFWRAYPVVLIW